jgi:hypothetical protein
MTKKLAPHKGPLKGLVSRGRSWLAFPRLATLHLAFFLAGHLRRSNGVSKIAVWIESIETLGSLTGSSDASKVPNASLRRIWFYFYCI